MQRANSLLHSLRGALASARRDTISQKKLASLLGIAEPTMSRWMSGKIKLGQIELLLRFIEQVPDERWQKEFVEVLRQKAGTHYVRTKRRPRE
jgi:transcriptional regulator with XRE-family HTH domain